MPIEMKRFQRLIRGLGVVTVVLFLVAGLTPIANIAARRVALTPQIEPGGAIVVLAAGIMRGGDLEEESLRRVTAGIELYKKGFAPLLVLSGGARFDEDRFSEAEVRARLAEVAGIARHNILKEETANTTREEAVRISAMLKERSVTRILLVTESLHLRRAKLTFEETGLQVLPVPSDDYSTGMRSPRGRLFLTKRIVQECLGLVYYRVAGYF